MNSCLIKAFCMMSLCLQFSLTAMAKGITVSVSNTTDMQRQELVELDADTVFSRLGIKPTDNLIVKNALGQEVAYQKTYDGKILIDAHVRPNGTATFTVEQGTPKPMKLYAFGRLYEERLDDMTWENDRGIYRMYGPALQKRGEKAYGVDVWTKNTPELVVYKRYSREFSMYDMQRELRKEGKDNEAKELEKEMSYHLDHGYGHDCYAVGPTLGCGTPALLDGDSLIMPYCFITHKILDNGPLRFTVQLDYNPTAIKGDNSVTEHRIVSLDKGSNYNRITVWYDGLTKACDMAAGVVIHSSDTKSVCCGDEYVLYADPTENAEKNNTQLYVGVVFPNGVKATKKLLYDKQENGIAGHAVGIADYLPGERYTYYFGSAWSLYDVRTFNEWKLRSTEFLNSLHKPLKVNIL